MTEIVYIIQMKPLAIILTFLMFLNIPLYSETTITATDASGLGFDFTSLGLTEVETLIQETLDTFGPGVSDGFALANMGGYPVGSAYLGGFPSFFVGATVSAGLTNMEYFDDESQNDNIKPAGGINPAVYFGVGMGKGIDLMFRFFTFSSGMYQPPFEKSYVSIEKLNLYSIGGKIRYNLVSKQTILPGLFNFGGVTVSLGADMLNGLVQVNGEIEYPMEGIEVNLGGGTTQDVDVALTPQYDAKVKWYMVSVSTNLIAYLDLFWIFGFYTGLGTSFNFGYFNVDMDASGTATTDDSAYTAPSVNPSGEIANVTLVSENKYTPHVVIPVYIVGFDISLALIRFTAESMVNLRNKKDINIQIGARVQI
jgi:hypothetical protein